MCLEPLLPHQVLHAGAFLRLCILAPVLFTTKRAWGVDDSMLRNHVLLRFGRLHLSTTARYNNLFGETMPAAVKTSASGTGVDWGQVQTANAGKNLVLVEA